MISGGSFDPGERGGERRAAAYLYLKRGGFEIV
jgi:hypothetical protein